MHKIVRNVQLNYIVIITKTTSACITHTWNFAMYYIFHNSSNYRHMRELKHKSVKHIWGETFVRLFYLLRIIGEKFKFYSLNFNNAINIFRDTLEAQRISQTENCPFTIRSVDPRLIKSWHNEARCYCDIMCITRICRIKTHLCQVQDWMAAKRASIRMNWKGKIETALIISWASSWYKFYRTPFAMDKFTLENRESQYLPNIHKSPSFFVHLCFESVDTHMPALQSSRNTTSDN